MKKRYFITVQPNGSTFIRCIREDLSLPLMRRISAETITHAIVPLDEALDMISRDYAEEENAIEVEE